MITRRSFGGLALAMLAASQAKAADALPLPAGKPILSVGGHISQPNSGSQVLLDRPTLEGLGEESFETSTPWYTGKVRFEGVPMSRLMQVVGASGKMVRAAALNDYTTDIPIEDFEKFGVLLALKRDGEYMPIRDKGPLFVVYPFDKYPELQTHQYYSRSAWQVASLTVS